MSRLMRGPLGFLAGWAERGLLAIGVLLRLLQSFHLLNERYGGFVAHIQEKPLNMTQHRYAFRRQLEARFAGSLSKILR